MELRLELGSGWSSLTGLEGPAGHGAQSRGCPGTATPVPCSSRCFLEYGQHIPLPKHPSRCFLEYGQHIPLPRHPSRSCRARGASWCCQGWGHTFQVSHRCWDPGAACMAHLHPPEQRQLRDLGGEAAPWDAQAVPGSPLLLWFGFSTHRALAPRSPLPADPNARIRSSSTPAPALTPDIWNAPPGVPKPAGSPQRREQSRESFSLRSHFIIVAKETSSQDLAWNMSASAGPHIHLSQSALRAGAGADKGGDGGGGSSGTTAAALNRPARAGCAARKSCQGSYKDKNQKKKS